MVVSIKPTLHHTQNNASIMDSQLPKRPAEEDFPPRRRRQIARMSTGFPPVLRRYPRIPPQSPCSPRTMSSTSPLVVDLTQSPRLSTTSLTNPPPVIDLTGNNDELENVYNERNFPAYEDLVVAGVQCLDREVYDRVKRRYINTPIPLQKKSSHNQLKSEDPLPWHHHVIACAIEYDL